MNWQGGAQRLVELLTDKGLQVTDDVYLDVIGWSRQLEEIETDLRRLSVISPDAESRRQRALRELDRVALGQIGRDILALSKESQAREPISEVVGDHLLRKTTNEDCQAAQYDIAISFAGEDIQYAESIAQPLRDRDVSVFFYKYRIDDLWGKDLAIELSTIYGQKARCVVILISRHYVVKPWTLHEFRSALSHAVRTNNTGYILPIRIDSSTLTGLPDSVSYLSINLGAEVIADMICRKLF